MSKFTKLSDEVIKKKLNSGISNDLPVEIVEGIKQLLSNFDRKAGEDMCLELENISKVIKEQKKREEEERKKLEAEQRKKEEENEEIEIVEDKKKEFERIIDKNHFTSLKNSFGIMQENENGEALFPSLHEQFKNEISKYPLRLYRVEYYEKPDFNQDREFIHKNLNTGIVSQLDDLKDYIFGCFRLSINPLTNKCVYLSWWIINAKEPLSEILGSDYDSFKFTEVLKESVIQFANEFKKTDSDAVLDEKYLR